MEDICRAARETAVFLRLPSFFSLSLHERHSFIDESDIFLSFSLTLPVHGFSSKYWAICWGSQYSGLLHATIQETCCSESESMSSGGKRFLSLSHKSCPWNEKRKKFIKMTHYRHLYIFEWSNRLEKEFTHPKHSHYILYIVASVSHSHSSETVMSMMMGSGYICSTWRKKNKNNLHTGERVSVSSLTGILCINIASYYKFLFFRVTSASVVI